MDREQKRRKFWPILISAFALVGVYAGWATFRPRTDLKLVGKIPPDMVVLPRSQFNSKPRIDIPWFGGTRFQYPPLGTMPKDWKEDPLVSGLITWKAPPASSKPPTYMAAVGGGTFSRAAQLTMFFHIMNWVDATGRVQAIPLSVAKPKMVEHVGCPYVFGNRPMRFKVASPYAKLSVYRTMSVPEFEIELPPIGFDAPKLVTKVVKVGPWEITLTPKSWIGPSFGARYEVSAKGLAPGEELLISAENQYNSKVPEIQTSFRVTSTETAIALVADQATFTINLVQKKATRVKIGLKKTSAAASYPATIKEMSVTDMKDKSLGQGFLIDQMIYFNPVGPRQAGSIVGLKVDGDWLGPSFPQVGDQGVMSMYKMRPAFSPGEYPAEIYVSKRFEQVVVKGLLADVTPLIAKSR